MALQAADEPSGGCASLCSDLVALKGLESDSPGFTLGVLFYCDAPCRGARIGLLRGALYIPAPVQAHLIGVGLVVYRPEASVSLIFLGAQSSSAQRF